MARALMKVLLSVALMALFSVQATGAYQERSNRQGERQSPNIELEEVDRDSRIVWYSVWEDAKAEAKRTGRPILLMSAAPRCNEVPGMW
ncbi:MAG: hypothetical protein ACI8X5_002372 [Planctomycetota bacterium]|jgi:hypothetical protein